MTLPPFALAADELAQARALLPLSPRAAGAVCQGRDTFDPDRRAELTHPS